MSGAADWSPETRAFMERMEAGEAEREAKLIAQVDEYNRGVRLEHQNERMVEALTRIRWDCCRAIDTAEEGETPMVDAKKLMAIVDWRD